MTGKLIIFLCLMFFASAVLAKTNNKSSLKNDSNEADRATIRESIENNLKKTLKDHNLVELEIFFRGDSALVCYGAANSKAKGNTYRMLDVYDKTDGKWEQVSSNSTNHPMSPITVSAEARKIILGGRNDVWQAWFTNNKPALAKAIPEEIIIISPGGNDMRHQQQVLSSSEQFVKSGGKLLRLEFPKDEIQVYGSTIILYSTYLYETESNGKKELTAGRATDMFIIRNGNFVNVGWHLDSGK